MNGLKRLETITTTAKSLTDCWIWDGESGRDRDGPARPRADRNGGEAMRKPRGVCAGCHARLARYTIISPETDQMVYVCDRCESTWARLPDRGTLTQAELDDLHTERATR